MSQANQHDPVWTLAQCAEHLRVKGSRVQRLLASAQIRPVRTPSGTGYRAAEVQELRTQIGASRRG